MSRPNYVFGWHSPRLAVWTVMVKRGVSVSSFFLGILRWLYWCLPYRGFDEHSVGYRFLAFYLNFIYGPYTCAICGRATTHGADVKYNIPAHCSRKECQHAAYEQADGT